MTLRCRAALATVAVSLLMLGTASAQIPVQIINNSPDPALAAVDIYVGGVKVADDLAYKQATPFVDQFGVPIITVAPNAVVEVVNGPDPDNTSPLASKTLSLGGQFTLLEVIGVIDPGLFPPNPDAADISLDVLVFEGYKPAATDPLTTELMAVHAAPDVGSIDLLVRVQHDVPGVGLPLFTNLSYGETRDYLVLQPVVATLDIVETGTSNVIESFSATLGLIVGAGAVGNAGGFLDDASGTRPPLSLFGAVASGFVFDLNKASRTDVGDSPGLAKAALEQNYPNPFNPTTTIPVVLSKDEFVTLQVFDLKGRLVQTILEKELEAGRHDIPFFGEGISSGTYMVQLRTADGTQNTRMTLLK